MPKEDLQAKMEDLWGKEIQKRDSMADAIREWQDDGFGIFMHFSPSTAFQGRYKGKESEKDLWAEWMMARAEIPVPEYEQQLRSWNPDRFDAGKWADVVAASGCRYFVFTAKHHDGLAMFKSEVNGYNIIEHTAFKKGDMFALLTEEVRKRGIKPGFYYSHHLDWHEPGGAGGPQNKTLDEYMEVLALPHLEELTTKYGKQHVAWFDCGRPEALARKCEAVVHRNQPNIMVCSRVGGGLGDFTSEGDCQVPPIRVDGPWETCMTLTQHWAWFPLDRDHKPAGEVIRMLAAIRSRGGNLLLNIGPDVRGEIPLRDQTILRQVGDWLKRNGESIFGVQATPYGDLPWGVCTYRAGTLYLHVFKLPSLDTLFLPGLKSTAKRACFLADDRKQTLDFLAVPGGVEIDLTSIVDFAEFADEDDTVLMVEFDGELIVDPRPVLDHDLDNRFIPALAAEKNGVDLRSFRRPYFIDHGTNAYCPHEDYAHGFKKAGAGLGWQFSNRDENSFFVNVEYANLTGRPVKVKLSVGGHELRAELPVTVLNERDWRWFRTDIIGQVKVSADNDQSMSFEVTEPMSEDRMPSYLADGKPGTEHDGFMIKSITLKSLAPLPYPLNGELARQN
ncbi:MAG: alpha-L-fucosidase [Verrucomicrobia bacterium]|nr:alpha-L-fucosidase [Verrucomicrobiota bacterium]